MKETAESSVIELSCFPSKELVSWVQLFDTDYSEQRRPQLGTGQLLRKIFRQLVGDTTDDSSLADSVNDTKSRLDTWRSITQDLRNYYLEVLQEIITMKPPNIVLISRSPDSAPAQREIEHFILLLLCAAVRCERRDHFIGQIMEHLSSETQAGLMNCIQRFTDSSSGVMSVDNVQSSESALVRKCCVMLNQLEDVYIEEVHNLLDQLNALQSKFTALLLSARRGRVLSSMRACRTDRSISTLSLDASTYGELVASTPKPEFYRQANLPNLLNGGQQPTLHHNHEMSRGLDAGLIDGAATPNWNSSDGLDEHFNESFGIVDLNLDSGIRTDSANQSGMHDIPDLYSDTPDYFHPECDKSRMAMQLAEFKTELRRARMEIEDQTDQINELHDQLNETRRELNRVKEERARLADAAVSARHWQDEVDALRESMERAQRLELENAKLKHRICEVDYYKARCDQLAGDLEAMVEQQSESPAARNGESDTRCTLLEELNKTRMKLADVEKLRSIDLDEMTKLREELGKLRLEQCTLISKNSSKKLALFGSIPEQLFRSNRHLSSKDASDSETSECSSAMRPEPTAPNLSVQLQESVTLPLTSNRTKHNHASWSATELTDTGTPLPEVEAIGRSQSEKSQSQRNDPVKRPAKLRNWRAFRRSLRSEHCDGRGASDDDMHDGDDDDERDEAEGVDSGNSTGNSTESASIGKLLKGQIQPIPDHHHRRRLKSIACSDSESGERESEAEYLNTSNGHLKQQFGTTGVHLSKNEQKIGVLKTNLRSEVALDYNEKSNMRIQPANSKTGLELSEHTGHLGTHANECHPNSKETNDALVSRKPHLESQTSNAEAAQQILPKEQPTRPGEMEASLLELSRQISVEKQMSAVLQEQLVAEKIKTEQQLTILNGIRTGFLLMGFDGGNIDRILHHDSNVNHADLLIQLLEEYRRSDSTGHQITEDTNQSLGRGTAETPTFSTASVIRRVTTEPQNQASDQHCIQGAEEVDASDCALSLGTSKNGFIQQPSENEKRDANNRPQIVNERFEQTILAVNKQLVSSQNHVAGLITTNARLQVENATLHSQVDSLSAQNAFLSGRTAELKIEANRLKFMLDEAHTAEAEISSDYKHLQNLYERLTTDYDAMNEALQESKEAQRRLKHRLGEASAELSHLQSTSKEVRVLKDALEVERDAFKGGVKQSVHLQEDCSRLRLQLESLTKERDRERSENSIMAKKMREDRRKIEELQNKMNELTFELTDQRDNDRKCKIELESLRSRIQTLSNRNNKLEEENRTFIIQFEALLGQNQEPFPTKTALFSNHLTEVGLIRDRLFSPQRQKQHLEDKLIQHYRNGSQSKKPQRRITLVQKARAALTKRKELEPVVQRSSDARDRTNSMQSQCQFSNENDGLFANSLAASGVMTTPNAAPVPGSVSLYDQDENKLSTNKYQAFLRCLDNSTLNAKTEAMRPRRQDASGYPSTCVLDSDFRQSWCPERPSEETSLATVQGAINSNGASELAEAPHRTKVPKSSSYQVDSGHQFPIETTERRSFHGTKFRGTPSQICLNATGCEPRDSSESTEAKSKQRGSESCGGQLYRKLPATDRCEKHLFEVVTIKSTCENLIASVHSQQGSKVSRSSSMRSFSPSHNANSGKIVERANSPLCNFPSEDHGKEKRFDHSLPHMRRPEKLKHQESGIRGNEDGWKSDSLSSLRFTRSKSSMSSHLSSHTNDTTEQNHNGSSNGHSTVESIRSLEVESKPRVLLEYGDL